MQQTAAPSPTLNQAGRSEESFAYLPGPPTQLPRIAERTGKCAPAARELPVDRGARSISRSETGRRPSFEGQSAKPAATVLARRPPPKPRAEWSPADEKIATLLVGLASGDELAFARFYLATRSRLLSVIARIERDSSEAEEILQEVYFNIWRRSDQFDGARGSAPQWVAGIARNRAIEHLRARERRPKAARLSKYEDDPYQGLPSGSPGLLEEAIRSDDTRAVWRGLRALAGPQRETVLLSFWGGARGPGDAR